MKGKRIYLIIPVLFFLPLFAYFVINLFLLRTLLIISSHNPIYGINILSNTNLLLDGISAKADKIKHANFFIKSIDLKKEYPDKLILTITDRIPVARVILKNKNFLIDDDGILMAEGFSANTLPEIKFNLENISYGYESDWKIKKAKDLILEAAKKGINISHILYDDNEGSFHIYLSGGTEIVTSVTVDLNTFVTSLQLIITRFRIEGKTITKIDFRFDKPVVILKNG